MAEIISGIADNIQQGSDYNYTSGGNNTTVAIKNQLFSLRIDNKPILFRTRTFPSITAGDHIAVVGKYKSGTFHASALKNLTTGAGYYMPTNGPLILGIISVVLGFLIASGLFIAGLPLWALGGWLLYTALNLRKANTELQAFNG